MSSPYVSSIRHRTRRALRACAAALVTAAALLAAPRPADAAGVLRPRDGSPPIAVQSQRVSAVLDDGLARTTLRQTFVSHATRTLEAVYEFPLPENAALVDVAMEVGGQRLEGLLVERQTARRIYDSIVRERRDPALVEQIGREMFRLSVFPVVPDAPTVVELTWIEQIPLVDGRWRYRYPLATTGAATEVQQDLTFALDVRSSAPLLGLESPLADVRAQLHSLSAGSASLERVHATLDEDIVVDATVQARDALLTARTFRDAHGATYVAALLTPPAGDAALAIPRDVTLVLDVSGSMRGEKIEQALAAARYLVEHARPIDRINVVRFASAVDAFAPAPVDVSEESRARLREFLRSTVAGGSTALGDALEFASRQPVDPNRVTTLVLLTDGRPTVGVTDATELIQAVRNGAVAGRRVFVFGVGADVDDGLLRGIAAATRGSAELFRPGGEIESRVSRFLRRTAAPALSDISVETAAGVPVEVFPRPLPDVYSGEQGVVTVRFADPAPTVLRLHARVGGQHVVYATTLPSHDAPGGEADVCRLYGRLRIAFLEEALRLRKGLTDSAYYAALDRGRYDTSDEIVQDIVATSLACGVQSAYASFLVVLPEDRARLDPRNLEELQRARERADAARRTAAQSTPQRTDGDTASAGPQGDGGAIVFEADPDDGAIGSSGGAAVGPRRRNLRAGGGGKKTQSAVDLCLEYLKAQQQADGSFPAGDASVGVTGTALLCFLGAGETHTTGQYKDTVRTGLEYLCAQQYPDGWFGPRDGPFARFDHTRAALAMLEAYGLTRSAKWRDAAERGLAALRSEVVGRAFDVDVVADAPWIMLAAWSAKKADLDVDGTCDALRDRAVELLESGRVPAACRDVALLAAVLGEAPEDTLRRFDGESAMPLPDWDAGRIDLDAVLCRTIVRHALGGTEWTAWKDALGPQILGHGIQDRPDGERRWHGQHWERAGPVSTYGAIHDTTLCQLLLEIFYRYGRVVGASPR